MQKVRFVLAGVVGAALALCASYSVGAFANGSNTATTYYACLDSGSLAKVGTVPPTCGRKATQISWTNYPESASGTPQCTGVPHVGIDLSGCDLQGANLSESDLSSANLSDANLQGANLSGERSVSRNTGSLAGANLENADLAGADLDATDVSGTQFAGADLSGIEVPDGLSGTAPASLPANWIWENDPAANTSFLLGPGVDLSYGDISDVDWNNADLEGANLSNFEADQSNLSGVNFTGANATRVVFEGGSTNLSGANFADANLSGADINSNADLAGVIWSNTTCPDGTNSNNDGGTCSNNLTP